MVRWIKGSTDGEADGEGDWPCLRLLPAVSPSLLFLPHSLTLSFVSPLSSLMNIQWIIHFLFYTKQVLLWKQFSDKLSVRFKLISSVKKKLHLRPLRQTKDVCRDRATDLKS